jgi:putative DNA primase/helicase
MPDDTDGPPRPLDVYAHQHLWVTWRYEQRKDGKRTKVPYSPASGKRAKSNDPATWGTRAQAEQACRERKHDGIGICFGPGSRLGGVDLDVCRTSDGKAEPWAALIMVILGSYTEISPSQGGAKIFFEHHVPNNVRWRKRISGELVGNKERAVEVYLHSRYFTVTDQTWHFDQVREVLHEALEAVQIAMAFVAMQKVTNNDVHRDDWVTAGMALWRVGQKIAVLFPQHAARADRAAYAAWVKWSAQSTKHHGPDGSSRVKWEEIARSPPDHLDERSIFKWASMGRVTSEPAAARPEPPLGAPAGTLGKPMVIEHPQAVPETLATCLAALINGGQVWRRERQLVVPDRSVVLKTLRGDRPHLAIVGLTPSQVMKRLLDVVDFAKWCEGKLVSVYPSARLVRLMMDYESDKPMGLLVLNGVSRVPFLRPDGTVCATEGYDPATGIFTDFCGTAFPPLPELSEDNAEEVAELALLRLLRPLRGYRFDSSKVHDDGTWQLDCDMGRAVSLAAMMTALTVSATRTRPMFLADAPVWGSGKTKLACLPAALVTGEWPPFISVNKRLGDEFDKQLDAALLSGMGFIVIDNLTGDLARLVRLTTLVTSASLEVRVFHTQQFVHAPYRQVITISGNNAETGEDTGQRVLRARIDTQTERPDRLEFDFDPVEEAIRDRAQLVTDLLTLMHAYAVAGRPPQEGVSCGSFEEWARLVRDPLLWLGLPDVATSNDEAIEGDDAREQLGEVVQGWLAAEEAWKGGAMEKAGPPYTVAQLIDGCDTGKYSEGVNRLREAFLAVASQRGERSVIDPRWLGRWLKQRNGRRVGDWYVSCRTRDGRSLYELRKG